MQLFAKAFCENDKMHFAFDFTTKLAPRSVANPYHSALGWYISGLTPTLLHPVSGYFPPFLSILIGNGGVTATIRNDNDDNFPPLLISPYQ